MNQESSKKRLRLSFDTVGTVSAMIIGICALFVTWDQAQVMRKQQHASVWPILTIDRGYDVDDGRPFFEFMIQNSGVGPAILKSAALKSPEGEIDSWQSYVKLLPAEANIERTFGSTIEGRALAPGAAVKPFRLLWSKGTDPVRISKYIWEAYDETSLEVCYCSVFDKCWLASSSVGGEPKPIKACPDKSDGIR